MSKTIITIKPIKTELLSSSKKTVVNQSSGQTTVMVHKIRTTVIGKQGHSGRDGIDGVNGIDGSDGLSAYEIALENGFPGTEIEWLESLKGQDGTNGIDGQDGQDGDDLTLQDFNASQEVSTLEESDEFFLKRGEEFLKISKENLQSEIAIGQSIMMLGGSHRFSFNSGSQLYSGKHPYNDGSTYLGFGTNGNIVQNVYIYQPSPFAYVNKDCVLKGLRLSYMQGDNTFAGTTAYISVMVFRYGRINIHSNIRTILLTSFIIKDFDIEGTAEYFTNLNDVNLYEGDYIVYAIKAYQTTGVAKTLEQVNLIPVI